MNYHRDSTKADSSTGPSWAGGLFVPLPPSPRQAPLPLSPPGRPSRDRLVSILSGGGRRLRAADLRDVQTVSPVCSSLPPVSFLPALHPTNRPTAHPTFSPTVASPAETDNRITARSLIRTHMKARMILFRLLRVSATPEFFWRALSNQVIELAFFLTWAIWADPAGEELLGPLIGSPK